MENNIHGGKQRPSHTQTHTRTHKHAHTHAKHARNPITFWKDSTH
jgi:hypothetical protein